MGSAFREFDEHYEILEGDELRVHCIFDSSCPTNATAHGACGRPRPDDTVGGWSTDNEMCFNFLAYYPSEHLQNPFCTMEYIQELGDSEHQPGRPDRSCTCPPDKMNLDWSLALAQDHPNKVIADDMIYEDQEAWNRGCHCEDVHQQYPVGSGGG